LKGLRVLLICLVAVALIVGVGLLSGMIPRTSEYDAVRPPCERLPDRQTALDAVASHQDLVRQLEDAGPGVTVDVATPCDDQPDRAVIRITYTNDDEGQGIRDILGQEGFGVAVEVVGD
jgi:hypothetical protein